jgi:hypothetical protein
MQHELAVSCGVGYTRACLKNHSRNLHAPVWAYFARIQLP